MIWLTHRGTDEDVARLVDDDLQDGAIQNDGDEEHQHHRNLQTRMFNLMPLLEHNLYESVVSCPL